MREVGWHYEQARVRIDALLRPCARDDWERSVPACPGWRVRDVLAHLVGNTEDGAAGRITGIPSEELTAEQVGRHARDEPLALLDLWAMTGPVVAEAISASTRWPPAIDALTHEHDLRGALDAAGYRDHESVHAVAAVLARGTDVGIPLAIEIDGEVTSHDGGGHGDGTGLRLRTSAFEFVRLRMGRRSRAQVANLDWSADPDAALDRLFVFGPSPEDIVE